MTTWAQLVDEQALNVISGDDLESELAHRFAPGYDGGHPGVPWTVVPDGTASGAKANGDGTFSNPQSGPQPNTPNNPYFGKQRLTGAQFVGICIGALGVTAANRVSADPAFASIRLWISTADVVLDPDDKAGQFIQLAGLPGGDGYLTTALAADGQPLLNQKQRDAIMKAWK